MADSDELVERALEERLPAWALWTAVIVVASTLFEVAFSGTVELLTRVGSLALVWSVIWVLAVRRPPLALVATGLSLWGIACYGWLAVPPFFTLAIALSVLSSTRMSVVLVGLLVAAASVLCYAFGDTHPVGHQMHAYDPLGPIVMMFAFGRVLRSSVGAQSRAQSLAERLEAANEVLRHDLEATEALAVARERTRIARELHDSLGHSLATIHVQNQLARKLASGDEPGLGAALDVVGASTREAMKSLRDCVAVLREPSDAPPLAERIRGVLGQLPEGVIDHRLRVVGTPRRLLPAREFVLYRALQEGITNITKHAHATSADVELRFDDGGDVTLTVHDDGEGAEPVRVGYGLRGLAERLESVGGRLGLSSAVGRGFRLTATVRGAP